MKQFSKILVVGFFSVIIVSCGKDRTREQQVSAMINKVESPFFVASMNVQSLMDKSEVMEEGTLPFTYYQVISFFLAVELTGIDYSTDAQLVVGEGESFLPNFYGIFKVNQEDRFIELMEVEANAEIKEKEGMKYAIKEKEGFCVVWNEEFAVISNIPMDLAAMLSGKGGKSGEKMIDKNIEIIKAAEDGEINDDYVSFLEKDADLAMMFEGEGFYQYMETMSMEDADEMEKMKELYEGMAYEMFLNFEDGKMVLELEADLDEELQKKLAFIGKDGVNDKLFKYGKSKSPLLTGTYKVDVDGALDYAEGMSEEDFNEMMDEMAEDGLMIEDVKSALTGEIVYMIDGIVKKEEVYDFGYDEPITINTNEPIFGVVVGIGDKGLVEEIMQQKIMESMQEVASTDPDAGYDDSPEINILSNGVVNIGDAYIYLLDDALFMSNDSSWAGLIASGKGVKVNNPDKVLNENPMGMYANLSALAGMDMGDDGAEMIKMVSKFYGSANLEGGKFTLEFVDDSQNSLKLITMAVGSILAEVEKNSNPDMEAELEEAIQDGEDAFDKLEDDLENVDIESEVNDVLNEIEKEINK